MYIISHLSRNGESLQLPQHELRRPVRSQRIVRRGSFLVLRHDQRIPYRRLGRRYLTEIVRTVDSYAVYIWRGILCECYVLLFIVSVIVNVFKISTNI